MSETASCPVCKSDSYLNPEIVLYVSPCFHKLCESCLNRLFNSGKANCPECGISLRRVNYISSTFEDIDVEKECKIRSKISSAFKKSYDDFEDPVLYNDYLEEVEIFVEELKNLKNESEIRQALKNKKRDMESLLNYIKPARKTISKFEYEIDNIRDIRVYDKTIKLTKFISKI